MRLEQFPKSFGLKELKKGLFPHRFNKPENQNYVGPIPAKEDYDYDYMTAYTPHVTAIWASFKPKVQIINFFKDLQLKKRKDFLN
jgi:hypothetical protein